MNAVAASLFVLAQQITRMQHGVLVLICRLFGLTRSLFSVVRQSISSSHQTYQPSPKTVQQQVDIATLSAPVRGKRESNKNDYPCATGGRNTQNRIQRNSLAYLLFSSQPPLATLV